MVYVHWGGESRWWCSAEFPCSSYDHLQQTIFGKEDKVRSQTPSTALLLSHTNGCCCYTYTVAEWLAVPPRKQREELRVRALRFFIFRFTVGIKVGPGSKKRPLFTLSLSLCHTLGWANKTEGLSLDLGHTGLKLCFFNVQICLAGNPTWYQPSIHRIFYPLCARVHIKLRIYTGRVVSVSQDTHSNHTHSHLGPVQSL